MQKWVRFLPVIAGAAILGSCAGLYAGNSPLSSSSAGELAGCWRGAWGWQGTFSQGYQLPFELNVAHTRDNCYTLEYWWGSNPALRTSSGTSYSNFCTDRGTIEWLAGQNEVALTPHSDGSISGTYHTRLGGQGVYIPGRGERCTQTMQTPTYDKTPPTP